MRAAEPEGVQGLLTGSRSIWYGSAVIVRTRFIVAVAALMAASALVAVPEPAGSSAPSTVRTVDDAQLRVVTVALPAGSTATAIPILDPAGGSAAGLEPGSTLIEPGSPAGATERTRPLLDQPAAPLGVIVKNYWRHDGNVSWYGPGFYGKRTACGYALTTTIIGVAHRTLPCGTLIEFRNPANGRTVTMPVIDRGPYVSGRTWDLTGGACRALGHCYTGELEWRYGKKAS